MKSDLGASDTSLALVRLASRNLPFNSRFISSFLFPFRFSLIRPPASTPHSTVNRPRSIVKLPTPPPIGHLCCSRDPSSKSALTQSTGFTLPPARRSIRATCTFISLVDTKQVDEIYVGTDLLPKIYIYDSCKIFLTKYFFLLKLIVAQHITYFTLIAISYNS